MRIKTLLAGAVAAFALTSPALAQDVAITGGQVLTGTSVIENGTIVIRGGKVVSVGTGAAPAGLRVIDARGKIVTPGFVAVDSGLGGTEVGSVRGTNDLANRANTLTAAFLRHYFANLGEQLNVSTVEPSRKPESFCHF